MTTVPNRDPLEEPPPCDCTDGWRYVQPPYAKAKADRAADDKHDRGTPEWDAAWQKVYELELSTVYPCKVHNPGAFFRWAGGHYDLGHDAGNCNDCIESMGGRRQAKRVAGSAPRFVGTGSSEPPHRRDTDD